MVESFATSPTCARSSPIGWTEPSTIESFTGTRRSTDTPRRKSIS